MIHGTISISITVTEEGFYTNASLDDSNFVCTMLQPMLDMSIASAMPFIREYATKIHELADAPPASDFLSREDWEECAGFDA